MTEDRNRIRQAFEEAGRLASVAAGLTDPLVAIAERYRATLGRGGTLFLAGNGGSAADAQHLAAEYVVRFRRNRRALPAIALTTDTSILTAAANDLGFEQVFARQVEALAKPGDLLVLLTTSGQSPNLLAAARAARANGVEVVVFSGRGGGALVDLADAAFVVPSDYTFRIQEVQLTAQHILAGLMEGDA